MRLPPGCLARPPAGVSLYYCHYRTITGCSSVVPSPRAVRAVPYEPRRAYTAERVGRLDAASFSEPQRDGEEIPRD